MRLVPDARNSSLTAPAPRSGAVLAAASVASGASALVLFGGCSSSCCYAPLGDAWAFAGGSWTNATQLGALLPSARLFHSQSAAADGGAYVFGGTDIVSGMLNDLWHLQLTTDGGVAWTQLSAATPVPARAGHTQTALSAPAAAGSFLLFGGESEDATLGDAWLFVPPATWRQVKATGDVPSPRTQHAAAAGSAGGRSYVFLHGGLDGGGFDLDDVFVLDVAAAVWTQVAPAPGLAGAPCSRNAHSAWLGATAAGADASVLVFGGQNSTSADPSGFLGDLWRLDITGLSASSPAATWTLVDAGGGSAPSATEPGVRSLSSLARDATGHVFLSTGFSGYEGGTDDRLHNDVWGAL
jgi:hypothetical protein